MKGRFKACSTMEENEDDAKVNTKNNCNIFFHQQIMTEKRKGETAVQVESAGLLRERYS